MAHRIKGILFDLGDTLLDFGRVDATTLFEKGGRLAYEYLRGLDQPVPSFAAFHRRQLWAIRWNYVKAHIINREFNAIDLIGKLGKRMGHRLTHQQMIELGWLWYKPLSEQATTEDGLRELLKEFCESGLTLGVVSNTFIPGQALDRHLDKERLLELLPVRIYSCDVRYRKPHPNIFRIALERGGLNPDETLFVGDSLRADVAGANRVGMISVLKITRARRNSNIRPRHEIHRLSELKNVLAQYDHR